MVVSELWARTLSFFSFTFSAQDSPWWPRCGRRSLVLDPKKGREEENGGREAFIFLGPDHTKTKGKRNLLVWPLKKMAAILRKWVVDPEVVSKQSSGQPSFPFSFQSFSLLWWATILLLFLFIVWPIIKEKDREKKSCVWLHGHCCLTRDSRYATMTVSHTGKSLYFLLLF